MNKILNQGPGAWAVEGAWAVFGGAIIVVGWLLMVVGFHDAVYPQEDSRIVWVCGVSGNGECGPDTPAVQVDLSKLVELF